ncbi:MAG: response regulator transcription factor [Candidatus Muiribacteriota bacterium]
MGNLTEMNITVVDDDRSLTKIINTYLTKNGYDVTVFNNPNVFFSKICDTKCPDMIVMDLMMPDNDGLTILKKIKDLQKTKHIPVLIMSAKNYKSTVLSCLSAGACDFLPKPFTLDSLVEKIKDMTD